MMKEEYVKPTMDIMEIESTSMLASSGLDIDRGSQGDFTEDFAPEKRGTWGNLWE